MNRRTKETVINADRITRLEDGAWLDLNRTMIDPILATATRAHEILRERFARDQVDAMEYRHGRDSVRGES
jgi:hypothetical protein